VTAQLLRIHGMQIELVSSVFCLTNQILLHNTKVEFSLNLSLNNIEIAVIPNSNEVHIYKYEPNFSDWTLLDNLDQHGLLITGIDWAPNTNRIVTCSAVRFFLFY